MSATSSWKGNMGGKCHQAGVLNGGLDGGGLQAIKAGQLHAVVADFFNFFHGAGKVFFSVLPGQNKPARQPARSS